MFYLAKYNTQTTFSFPLIKRGVVDFAVSADYTPAAADSSVSKDQGSTADTSNTVTAVTGGGTRSSALWKLTLTSTELSAAEIVVQIVDAATKAIEDQVLIIYTYGNASAKIPFDFSDAVRAGLTGIPNATPGAAGGMFIAGTNAATTITSAGGDALTLSSTGTNGNGLVVSGNGSGDAIKATGGATGNAFELIGGGTSGDGLKVTTTVGHGFNIAATGTSKHGITATGGNAGTSDGIKGVAGTGGVDIRGAITGNITGNLSGSVGSVTGLTASNLDTTVSSRAAASSFTFSVAGMVDANVIDWKSATAPAMTGDAFARLGAPAGASVSADIAAVKVDIAAVKSDTGTINTNVAALPNANANADALLDRSAGVETGLTPRQWFRIAAAALFGKASGLDTAAPIYRDTNDTKNRITATTDTNGNRTAVTLDSS